jgi:hypothetical protein
LYPLLIAPETEGCNRLSQDWTQALLWAHVLANRRNQMTFRIGRKRAAALIVAVFLACGAIAAAQGKVDVTGNWVLEVMTQAGGTTMPTITLKQDGEKLTGHYSSQTLGEANITGTIKGQQIEFGFSTEVQGFALQVRYTGTVNGNTMTGKISLGELGDGTFTGKKQ